MNMGSEEKVFFFLQCPGSLWGPPNLLFNGCPGLFPAVKQPPRVDIQNEWSLMLISALHASSCYLIKHKNNFTFLPLE
jgi:hypothetical protein